jgi:WD40 repeat protein
MDKIFTSIKSEKEFGDESLPLDEDGRNSTVNTVAEDDYYDTRDALDQLSLTSSEQIEGPIPLSAKVEPTLYAQLSSFAGLSSPLLASSGETPLPFALAFASINGHLIYLLGEEGSVVSSLSSLSGRRMGATGERTSATRNLKSDSIADMTNFPININLSSKPMSKKPRRLSNSGIDAPVLSANEEGMLFQYLFSTSTYPDKIKVSSLSIGKTDALLKDSLRFLQRLDHHEGPVWTMKFSLNGLYLASGGQDCKIFVWCVANCTEQRDRNKSSSSIGSGSHSYCTLQPLHRSPDAPSSYVHTFFNPEPYRVYEGHSGDIIDFSWSTSCFLLSASIDKTVRLWHVSRNDCLQYFRHPDIVTSVEFHPLHDRYFISGCFDRRLRVWDIIPDGAVREWAQAPDTVSDAPKSSRGSE